MKKINVSLYGGKNIFGGRETPLEADEIYCDKADNCSFYKSNKCLRCRSFSPTCIFGRNNIIKGYTSRAQKYYSFKDRYKQDEQYSKLKYPSELVATIDDMLYMNLKYVLVRKRTERDEKWKQDINGYLISNVGFCRGDVFIPIREITNGLLNAIFSYEPQAMMGGTIRDYQEKIVPEILQEMKTIAPIVYSEFVSEYPQFVFEPNYVGKKAYLISLKPGTEIKCRDKVWIFDGEYVFSKDCDIGMASPWWLQSNPKAEVKIKVDDKMTVEITDNSMVDENTIFES